MTVGIEEALLPEETPISRTFTAEDKELLRSYEGVVMGMAELFGKHCEVVLHSLENLHESVIMIANGFNTGRTLGAPITDLALRMLKDIETTGQDYTQSYFTRSRTGALMKSTTIAIRNKERRVIGLICINLHINAPFHEFVAEFFPTPQQVEKHTPETFANSVEELVAQTVDNTIDEINRDPTVANNAKNRFIVTQLFEKGIFDIKDSINLVADKLNISKHTVYLYIRQRKQGEEESE
ncbi:helix-turn-helix transcriptional regulator [Aeromonas diversa]|uniref:MukF protein n=1 Tax=Aeromonas diversa CDC 2478-85 TaxID=1268237 RepID=N9V5T4_9GAMM|nr:transcriptional regulator [Aeromonas diversa]ENY70662.1 MukF protein [Aeromonas diversa CDC 2478-85]